MKLTLADLDTERPEIEPDPFVIDLGDEEVALPAARDIPASLLVDLGAATEMELAARILGTDEWSRILKHPSMTLFRLQRLSAKYYEYLKESGLGDLGKAPGSPDSSTGTAPH